MRSTRSLALSAPRHPLVLAIVLFVITVALGLAVRFSGALQSAQLPIDRAVNAVHSSVLDTAALALDQLDHPLVVGAILIVVFAILTVLQHWSRALAVVVIAGAGWVTCLVVKAIVHQPRPEAALVHPLHLATASTYSYPSGHVAFIAALAVAITAAVSSRRALVVVVFVVIALVVGWSRLYLGVHYPTDVLGGLLNGVAGTLLFLGVWNLIARRVTRRRAEPARA